MGKKIHRNAIQPGHRLHWYRIEAILGQGGFGISYLAHDLNLDEDVAIKEYLPMELAVREADCSVSPVSEEHGERFQLGMRKFINEARTLSKFRHANIVRVRSVFEANNTAYMVMDYEDGETLKDVLARRGRLDEAELLGLLLPILGGLEHVHGAGYIHRDVKPANIFIRRDGSPVLLDFGSARQAVGTEGRTLTSLVSPGYAPFEQYYSNSGAQGPWTDIYGLGATLYRAVAGRPPLDAVDRSESILRRAQDTFVPASELGCNGYSRRFLEAINHALAFRPEDRPRTIAQWRSELQVPAGPARGPAPCEEPTLRPEDIEATERAGNPAKTLRVAAPGRLIAVAMAVLLNLGFIAHALWRQPALESAGARVTQAADQAERLSPPDAPSNAPATVLVILGPAPAQASHLLWTVDPRRPDSFLSPGGSTRENPGF